MSSDKRSVLLHQSASTESMGFDRFVLGATLAACAYLAQTIPFAPVGHNIETMYLWTLVVMAAAALLGFKRIEAVIETVKLTLNTLRIWRQAKLGPNRSIICIRPLLKSVRVEP